MTEEQYIIHFIRKYHEVKTIEQMAEKLEIDSQKVRYICKKISLVPITAKQQKITFIKNNLRMTGVQIAERLNVTPQNIYDLCKETGIKLAEEVSEIDLAKRILQNPSVFTDTQLLVAENIRRLYKEQFQ